MNLDMTDSILYLVDVFEILSRALVLGKVWGGGAGLAPCKIHSVALLRALVSIVVQFQWQPVLDDTIAMYFPADPASLHSFPPCLLYQQQGGLVIVPILRYRILFRRFFTGIFGRSIGTLTVRVYRCGPLVIYICIKLGPSMSSVICKNMSYSGPLYPSSPVVKIYFWIFFPAMHDLWKL